MSQLYNLSRNEESIVGKILETEDDMIEVWKFAKANGYQVYLNADAAGNPTLGLSAPGGNTSTNAVLGDWAVLKNDTIVNLIPAALGPATYTVGAPVT